MKFQVKYHGLHHVTHKNRGTWEDKKKSRINVEKYRMRYLEASQSYTRPEQRANFSVCATLSGEAVS